jgi:hypothetical protein
VISQIYGGGGTSGATYLNSYLEVFNRGNTTIDLNHYLFLFGPDVGPFTSGVSFTVGQGFPIQPGQHRLIQLGSGGSSGGSPPVPPDIGLGNFVNIGLSGKIAIAKPGSAFPVGSCPLPNSDILDFVGFGSTATCFEGSGPTPTLSNTTAAIRKTNGCTDTDDNAGDFSIGPPNFRDGISAFTVCFGSLQFSATNYNVSEGGLSANVTVTRSGDTTGVSTVDFLTSDGSAKQTQDYVIASGTLSFAAGETNKTFGVLIVDDAFIEANKTLNLTLSNPTGATLGAPSTATITITDNDSAGSISPVPKRFAAALDGLQETPPNNAQATSAKGTGLVLLNSSETSALVGLQFQSLSSAETAAHIHGNAAPGVPAPILFPLTPIVIVNPLVNFQILPTPQQVADLKANLHYQNVHSTNFPNGEIRGQLRWNPTLEEGFLVRQQYLDFLSREPDTNGFNFWVGSITPCQTDTQCFHDRTIAASDAFFFEPEFQQTAGFVFRAYRAAFGDSQPFPNPGGLNANELNEAKKLVNYSTFVADRARVVGGANLAAAQLAFANLFASRSAFTSKYAAATTGPLFVAAILATIQSADGVDLSAQTAALVNEYNIGGRGQVLYRLADDSAQNPINNQAFVNAEYNRQFALTLYFGYLRRNPDMFGFLFWQSQINLAPVRDVPKQNALVCSFITADEYQKRFGLDAPRTNAECPQ